MRTVILVVSFLPFLYFGFRDTMFHFRGRRVSVAEHLLHLGVGVALAILFTQALYANYAGLLGALLLFLLAGGIDEYIFHRQLPGEESDLHAKEHLALVIFIAISLTTDWIAQHPGQLERLLPGPAAGPGSTRTQPLEPRGSN